MRGGYIAVRVGELLVVLTLLAACGVDRDEPPPPPTLPQATFAYVANLADNTVSIYAEDVASGQWRPRGYIGSAGLQPYAVATHPTGKFVYVTADTSSTIAAYAIDPKSGFLTQVSNSAAGTNPQSIAISRSGKFAYVANRNIGGTGSVSTYTIDTATGTLPLSPIDNDLAGGEPHSITLDPSGKFAYTANFATNDISIFSIDDNGMLAAKGTATVGPGTNPNYLVVHPSGKYAYTANWGNGTISVFSIDASGALTARGAVGTDGANPAVLAMDPSGTFIFVTNFGASNVAAFKIDPSTGALSRVPGSPFATGANPHFVEVDPAGSFVYVGNFGGHSVSAYALDGKTGALTPLTYTPQVATRYFPVTFAINGAAAPVSTTPKFAYVANSGTNDITAYAIDATNGALNKINCVAGGAVVCGATDPTNFSTGTPISGVTTPISLVVDPLARFVYVANEGTHTIAAYSIAADGALAKINCIVGCEPNDPTNFAAGVQPVSVTVDASSRFVYVANRASGNVTGYRIGADGTLATINNFAAGNNPQAVTIDPTGRFAYVANLFSNDITVYLIDAITGALSKINCVAGGGVVCGAADPTNFAAGVGPAAVTIDSSGRYAYVPNIGSNDVSVYAIDAASLGALRKINCVAGGAVVCGATDPTNFAAGVLPGAIAIEPFDRYAYVANSGNSQGGADVSGYAIGSDAALAQIDCLPGGSDLVCNGINTVAGSGPVAIAVDPSGNYAYVANLGSSNITAYRIGSGGLLGGASYFATGTSPASVVVTGSYQ